jgi:hypothetical protein
MKKIQRYTVAAPYVNEYIARQRLKKLGFTSNINELDDYKAEIFLEISVQLDELEKEETKRKTKHGRK